MKRRIELVFKPFVLDAEVFDTAAGRAFLELLPVDVSLQEWGEELYGPLPRELPAENCINTIPPGGLAYSPTGGLLCIFYGQDPAWPVEHIGSVKDNTWEKLKNISLQSVHIRACKE